MGHASFAARATHQNHSNSNSFQTKGAMIMCVSEAIYKQLVQWMVGSKDSAGMPVQPAHIRAIALNMAQELVKQKTT